MLKVVEISIFKAYDIRGVYPDELDEDMAYRIGRAVVVFLNPASIVVARDARTHSPVLFEALTRGITDQGADVIDVGLCSTPMFYFAVRDAEAGITVTASHNPPQYNGFKLTRNGAAPISGATGIKDIEKLAMENKFPEPKHKGSISKREILHEYISFFKPFSDGINGLKVVVDAGNGMGGLTFPELFKTLDVEFVPLYCDIDMSFPNHEANPLKSENLRDLQKKVLEEKADLGISLDGDADRCAFVDEKGDVIVADYITALVGVELQKSDPNSTIIYDLRSTRSIKEEVEKAGGKAVMYRVGHAFIKEKMRELNAIFAGELSGHFYYQKTFTAESSILTSLIVMRTISGSGVPFSEIIRPFMRYPKIEETNFDVEDKEGMMKKVAEAFPDAEILHIDGVSIIYSDWWANVRPSNTEPKLRLNMEADTKEKLDEMKDKIISIIKGP